MKRLAVTFLALVADRDCRRSRPSCRRRSSAANSSCSPGGCNDCHTPLRMGPNGPEPDMTRMLSGHPENACPAAAAAAHRRMEQRRLGVGHGVRRPVGHHLCVQPDARPGNGHRQMAGKGFRAGDQDRQAHGRRPSDPAADAVGIVPAPVRVRPQGGLCVPEVDTRRSGTAFPITFRPRPIARVAKRFAAPGTRGDHSPDVRYFRAAATTARAAPTSSAPTALVHASIAGCAASRNAVRCAGDSRTNGHAVLRQLGERRILPRQRIRLARRLFRRAAHQRAAIFGPGIPGRLAHREHHDVRERTPARDEFLAGNGTRGSATSVVGIASCPSSVPAASAACACAKFIDWGKRTQREIDVDERTQRHDPHAQPAEVRRRGDGRLCRREHMLAQRRDRQADDAGRRPSARRRCSRSGASAASASCSRALAGQPGHRVDPERRELRRPRQRRTDGEIGETVLERAEFAPGIAQRERCAGILPDLESASGLFVHQLRPALAGTPQRIGRRQCSRQAQFRNAGSAVLRLQRAMRAIATPSSAAMPSTRPGSREEGEEFATFLKSTRCQPVCASGALSSMHFDPCLSARGRCTPIGCAPLAGAAPAIFGIRLQAGKQGAPRWCRPISRAISQRRMRLRHEQPCGVDGGGSNDERNGQGLHESASRQRKRDAIGDERGQVGKQKQIARHDQRIAYRIGFTLHDRQRRNALRREHIPGEQRERRRERPALRDHRRQLGRHVCLR